MTGPASSVAFPGPDSGGLVDRGLDEPGVFRRRALPAQDPVGERLDHERGVGEHAAGEPDVGEVRHQQPCRCWCSEPALAQGPALDQQVDRRPPSTADPDRTRPDMRDAAPGSPRGPSGGCDAIPNNARSGRRPHRTCSHLRFHNGLAAGGRRGVTNPARCRQIHRGAGPPWPPRQLSGSERVASGTRPVAHPAKAAIEPSTVAFAEPGSPHSSSSSVQTR
jgi:hypothetical protein